MIKVEAFTDYSSVPYTLNLDDFALAIIKQPYIQGSKCRAVELHHMDRIYVSTKLLGIDNAQPGDTVTRYLRGNAIFDIKCDDTWEFMIVELRYNYKPKWWQFWKKPVVDGYIVQVIRKDEEKMFTLIDKCYHKPRSCDLLQELREVQEAMKELKKKESPALPVGTPYGTGLKGVYDWLYTVMSGRARIDSAPRYCWDYVQQDGQNSDVAFTEYLYKLADYIREIADCRENWENYKAELTTLSQRETELKKLMGIE